MKNKTIMRNGGFFCTACGTHQPLVLSCPIQDFGKQAKKFDKEHQDCLQTWQEPVFESLQALSIEVRKEIWLKEGETGLSSIAIFSVISGENIANSLFYYPMDAGDFGRCVKLLDLIPEFREFLYKMKEVSAEWKALVEHWKALEILYRDGQYELLNEIINNLTK